MTILVRDPSLKLILIGTPLAIPTSMDLNVLPAGTFDHGVVGGVLVAMAFFVLVCLMRALVYIREYGILSYLKGAFRIQNDSLGLVLTLLVLLLVVVLFFRREP